MHLKHVIINIIITLAFFSCNSITKTTNQNLKINNLIDKWHVDASKADFTSYFNAISNDGYFIGTDASEVWTKQAFQTYAKTAFEQKSTWHFKTIERHIAFSKNKQTAWFNELLDTWMGTCRGSGVLELEKGSWQIKQYVLSVTVPNEDMTKVIKLLKK